MVLNPGSKGYSTLSKLAGGNPELLQQLQMGVIARASKGSSLSKRDLSDSNRALDLMGVGKESPLRSIFRYNTSEARKLEAKIDRVTELVRISRLQARMSDDNLKNQR